MDGWMNGRERDREREKDNERDREGERRGRKKEERRTTKPIRNTKFAPPQKKRPADKPLTSADKRCGPPRDSDDKK
mgnify:CR=1 FL=1